MMRCLRAIAPCLAVLAMLGLAVPASADPTAADNGSRTKQAPATMSAVPGEPVQLDERPRRTLAHEVRGNDHHTAYLGAAVVALGVMVWWNRRRRDRFEREDRVAAAAHTDKAAARTDSDDDADDLHAAARRDADDATGAAANRKGDDATGAAARGNAPDGGERRDSSARPEASEARETR